MNRKNRFCIRQFLVQIRAVGGELWGKTEMFGGQELEDIEEADFEEVPFE